MADPVSRLRTLALSSENSGLKAGRAERRIYDERPLFIKKLLRNNQEYSAHGRYLLNLRFRRVHPGGTRSHLAVGARMSFSQIILFIVAVVMFFYIGYAMFKPEKF
jgi:hypothetical protein